MARPTTTLSARLRSLEEAKARAATLKRGAKLSFVPMAEILRVSRVALRDWCNDIPGFEQSGAFVRGGNGIEWEFDPRKTVAFLLKHFGNRADAQAKQSRDISKAVGVTLPDAEPAPSLQETKDLVNLTLTVVSATEKQKRYVLADDMADFIDGYNQRVVSSILGVRTSIDPNGNLSPAVRAAVDDYLRRVATEVHAGAVKFLEECGAGSRQAGTG